MNEIDEIRWQMAQIRRDLHRSVADVVDSAERAVDWRSYVRSQPWLSVGAAFVVGYLLVPSRSRTERVVVTSAQNLMSDGSAMPSAASAAINGHTRKRPFSTARWIFGLVRPIALQAAQSYAAVWVEDLLTRNHPVLRARGQAFGDGPLPGNGVGDNVYENPSRR